MDTVKIIGKLKVTLSTNGKLKESFVVDNLVVSTGKTLIASRLSGSSSGVVTHMALGSGAIAPSTSNTALGAEIVGSRTALTVPGGSPVLNVITFDASFGPGVSTGAITEAGLFNDSVAGSMLSRTTFGSVNKDVSDTLDISWALTII